MYSQVYPHAGAVSQCQFHVGITQLESGVRPGLSSDPILLLTRVKSLLTLSLSFFSRKMGMMIIFSSPSELLSSSKGLSMFLCVKACFICLPVCFHPPPVPGTPFQEACADAQKQLVGRGKRLLWGARASCKGTPGPRSGRPDTGCMKSMLQQQLHVLVFTTGQLQL